uniref:Uncharacterized protein n=1 Tax=Trichogramma kaykai TaxID=54128 RepID=A0ABD2W7L6_9HYME
MKYSRASLCLHMTREGLRDIPASDHFNYNLYSRAVQKKGLSNSVDRSRECENGQSCMRALVKLMEVKLKVRKGRSAAKKKQQQQRIIASRKTHTHTRCTHTRVRAREANGSFEEA